MRATTSYGGQVMLQPLELLLPSTLTAPRFALPCESEVRVCNGGVYAPYSASSFVLYMYYMFRTS